MTDKEQKIVENIDKEIERIDNSQSNVYFFVLDTKGVPDGSVEYIYKLAKILSDNGKNVTMLYQENLIDKKDDKGVIVKDENGNNLKEDPFVGVEKWLGKEYSELPHVNTISTNINVKSSDILFIPELFASVMKETRKFPCERIVIAQNYNFIAESMPLGDQWGDYGIIKAIVPTQTNADLIKDLFPYVSTTVIDPYLDDLSSKTEELPECLVNVVSKNEEDMHRVIKPFYWKYPMFKWITFRELRNLPQNEFIDSLKKAAFTLWIDDDDNFALTPLQAMNAGAIVIGKVPDILPEWLVEKKENGSLNVKKCGYWFSDLKEAPIALANVIKDWITDNIPSEIGKAQYDAWNSYNDKGRTTKEIYDYVNNIFDDHKKTLLEIKNQIVNKNENK